MLGYEVSITNYDKKDTYIDKYLLMRSADSRYTHLLFC